MSDTDIHDIAHIMGGAGIIAGATGHALDPNMIIGVFLATLAAALIRPFLTKMQKPKKEDK